MSVGTFAFDPEGRVPLIDPSCLTYDHKYELDKNWLWWEPGSPPLGSGHFGKVIAGTIQLPLNDADMAVSQLAKPRHVAIKMPLDGYDAGQQKALQVRKVMCIAAYRRNRDCL